VDKESIIKAREEAKRFILKAEDAEDYRMANDFKLAIPVSKEAAAYRRASMDRMRELDDMMRTRWLI